MMKKIDYIKCMNKELMVQFLAKGGFCPEKVDAVSEEFDDKGLRCFITEDGEIEECEVTRHDAIERSGLCVRCIEEFLEEEIDFGKL